MSLEGLLKIDQIRAHPADAADIQRLLAAAARNLDQSSLPGALPTTRFDCAYKTIQQAALAALYANGYRPNTSRPGHHMTIIQALPHTIGIDKGRIALLDSLRHKRNAADYSGYEVEAAAAEACFETARTLLQEVTAWLHAHHPELL